MSHKTITIRIPDELLARIDTAVKREAGTTGLRVDRSSIVRRALMRDLADIKVAAAKMKAAK